MPRRKPSRSQRRRAGRVGAPPAAQPPATAPVARPAPVAAVAPVGPRPAEALAREPSATRFTVRDYAYVRNEVRRILILAAAVVVTLIVLSFFLP